MLYEKQQQQQQGEKRREEEKKVLKRSQMSNNKNGSWRRDRKQISGSCKKIILCTSSSTQSEYDRELSQKMSKSTVETCILCKRKKMTSNIDRKIVTLNQFSDTEIHLQNCWLFKLTIKF